MTALMTIGDFSRASRLSAKTLRYYHDVGLLAPATIDPSNAYRRYESGQIATAQIIRQLRALDVPVDTIRQILDAEDVAVRTGLITAHLARLEVKLEATAAAVSSLRGLLADSRLPIPIEHRSVPAFEALVVRDRIDLGDLSAWYLGAHAELSEVSRAFECVPTGPRGGIWDTNLFLHERGEALLFAPISRVRDGEIAGNRARIEVLPAVDIAVAVHRGPDETIAQTYGALGAYVSEFEIGLDGPVRETYLHEPSGESRDVVTEIGWPIFRSTR